MSATLRLRSEAPPVGPISLGTSTFGREIGREQAFPMMDAALERGVTLIDTAARYSAGASETLVGDWLRERKIRDNQISVATKLYPPYTAAEIDRGVAESAKRLGLERIDLLYLHVWEASAAQSDCARALDRLVRSGRVCKLGISNVTAPQLRTVLGVQTEEQAARMSVLQNNHNLAVRDISPEIRSLCAQHDIGIVTFSPLGAGFLTGKHRQGVAPGSRFDVAPGHQAIYFQPLSWQRLDRLENVARRLGLSPTHLALAWALHEPGVASVLVGGRNVGHLDQAFAALDFADEAVFREASQD